jgi:hypothetical protein
MLAALFESGPDSTDVAIRPHAGAPESLCRLLARTFDTGSVGSTGQTHHCLLQPDILAPLHAPAALISSPGNQQIDSFSFRFTAFMLCLCAETPVRLTISHGPGQSHMFHNRDSLEPRDCHTLPSSGSPKHHKRHSICTAELCPMKPSVWMCFCTAHYERRPAHSHILAIALLPKHKSI